MGRLAARSRSRWGAALHARRREASLRQLGRERFDELLAEGAWLGLDAAVKLAIRELRDLDAQ